jgi:large subunit ribosomal protein L21
MSTYAVVAAGGKQFLVTKGAQITVDHIKADVGANVDLPMLAKFDESGEKLELGTPEMNSKVSAKVVEHGKGDKVRIAKFKSKVRYRKVQGFRPSLTTLEVVSL